jgi:hypothetical protein
MKAKLSKIIHALSVLLIAALSWLVVEEYRSNLAVQAAYSAHGLLSPDLRKELISALESGNTNSLRSWADYFRHTLDLETNLPDAYGIDGIDKLYAVYKSREYPARSVYFSDLVRSLAVEQQRAGLTEAKVTNYLGQPDKTVHSNGVKYIEYTSSTFGGAKTDGLLLITNGVVSVIYVGFPHLENTNAVPIGRP